MDSVIKYKFTSKTAKDPVETTKAYVMWAKADQVIKEAFPNVSQYIYHKKLMLYGTQRFWESTWFDRYHTTKILGESDYHVNMCWASLIRYHLDIIWPRLDDDNHQIMAQLVALHQVTNRIKGAKFHGLGLAMECSNPNRVEGFIDLYRDITGTNQITTWAKEKFLANK